MQFFNPGMLMTLGLIPILILIHTLKPKPKTIEVTNLFLWQEVLKERSRNLSFKRLRKNLPLVFQILIVLLTALALARPAWLYFTQKKGDIILVVDISASMKTKLASGTRFDLARKKAYDLLDQREDSQKILIVEAGNTPTIKSGFVENTQQAKNLIKHLNATDAPGDVEKAVYLALSFIDPSKDDIIYLITDAAGRDLSPLLKLHQKIIPVVISGGENNIGITKFEFRQEIDRKDNYEIMLELKNFGSQPVDCPIHLSIDRTGIFDTKIALSAHEKKLLIFPYSGLITGLARAVIEIDDDFAVDNTAFLSLNTSKDIWVLLVSKGNFFLEKILEAYPNFMVNSVKDIIPSSWQEQTRRHDLVIIDRMDFPATRQGNFLLINSYSSSIPLLKTGEIDFPQVIDWDKSSPLMANVDLRELAIEQASRLEAEGVMQPVMESSQTGLMYTYEEEGLKAVILGFDITRSDLPLKVAFPVMMSNIINWLNPHKLDFSTLQTKAGEPFDIYLEPETQYFSTRAPGEKWQKHKRISNPFRYTHTKKVGIYTIAENSKRRHFTVNLVDESESDIKASDLERSAKEARAAFDSEKIATQQPLWYFFLLLTVAMLLMEWYFWLKLG